MCAAYLCAMEPVPSHLRTIFAGFAVIVLLVGMVTATLYALLGKISKALWSPFCFTLSPCCADREAYTVGPWMAVLAFVEIGNLTLVDISSIRLNNIISKVCLSACLPVRLPVCL